VGTFGPADAAERSASSRYDDRPADAIEVAR
jgi:hypothetical protein